MAVGLLKIIAAKTDPLLSFSLTLYVVRSKSTQASNKNNKNLVIILVYITCTYGTDLMQVCARARVHSRVRALASSFEHASASASFEYKHY